MAQNPVNNVCDDLSEAFQPLHCCVCRLEGAAVSRSACLDALQCLMLVCSDGMLMSSSQRDLAVSL
jgi:hypothetical protein